MRNLKAAIIGAVCVTVLWYICSTWVIVLVGGYAWWVITVSLVAGGAGLGVVSESYLRSKESRHASAAIQTANQLRLTYTPTVERPSASLPCFQHWVSGWHGSSGEIHGVPVSLFDMTEVIPGDEGASVRSSTTVLMPAPGLPDLTASPRPLSGFFDRAFGLGGMTFDSAAASADLASTVRRFGRAILIEYPGAPGPTKSATPKSMEQDAAIRRLVGPGLMAVLLDHRGWSFQTGDGWLACWRGNSVRTASERPDLIDTALKLRAALLAAAADTMSVALPAPALPSPGQYVARMLLTFAGALLGFFIVFPVIAGALRSALVPFFPVFVIAGAFLGGLIGYWIGATLGRVPMIARWTPPPESTPEELAKKQRQGRWLILFGAVGWFAGAIGGGGLLFLLHELRWAPGPAEFGILIPLLFFGGGFAGVICSLMVGIRFVSSSVQVPSNSDSKPANSDRID